MDRKAIFERVASGELSVDEAEALLGGGPAQETKPVKPSVDELVTLAAHGADANYRRRLQEAGVRLCTDHVIALASNRVPVELIVDLDASVHVFGPHEIIALAANGMDAAWFRELREAAGCDMQPADLIAIAASRLDRTLVTEMVRAGLDRFSVPELLGMAHNGIDAPTLEGLMQRTELSGPELIALAAKASRA